MDAKFDWVASNEVNSDSHYWYDNLGNDNKDTIWGKSKQIREFISQLRQVYIISRIKKPISL